MIFYFTSVRITQKYEIDCHNNKTPLPSVAYLFNWETVLKWGVNEGGKLAAEQGEFVRQPLKPIWMK
jgi:hypothetical protein